MKHERVSGVVFVWCSCFRSCWEWWVVGMWESLYWDPSTITVEGIVLMGWPTTTTTTMTTSIFSPTTVAPSLLLLLLMTLQMVLACSIFFFSFSLFLISPNTFVSSCFCFCLILVSNYKKKKHSLFSGNEKDVL